MTMTITKNKRTLSLGNVKPYNELSYLLGCHDHASSLPVSSQLFVIQRTEKRQSNEDVWVLVPGS